ncbi:MAG: hypothetical protein Fur0021_16740 [Candidatus Promineifilaceae bacterium]
MRLTKGQSIRVKAADGMVALFTEGNGGKAIVVGAVEIVIDVESVEGRIKGAEMGTEA